MSIKKQSIKSLAEGISKFENNKNIIKNSDFSDFKQFLKKYLNTPEPKQRRKLAEEFKKRHLELYEFLKNNADLINAEIEINKMTGEYITKVQAEVNTSVNPFSELTVEELKKLAKD